MLTPARLLLRVEEVFGIEFNEHQLKHYKAARTFVGFPSFPGGNHEARRMVDDAREWLAFTGNRGQGRTMLMAICFLEFATENPGKRIDYFDHHTGRGGAESLKRALEDLTSKHKVFAKFTKFIPRQSAFIFEDPYAG